MYYAKKLFCPKYILVNTPTHGNLGDQAIAIAEIEFLEKIVDKRRILELDADNIRFYFNIWRHIIRRRDILIITGGGYLGDLWPEEEAFVLRFINAFHNNKIIIMPQTVFYRNSEKKRELIRKASEVYKRCGKGLYFFARDKKSYEFVKNEFSCIENVYLVPDIVLTMKRDYGYERKDILLCFRNDLEKQYDKCDEIENYLIENGYKYSHTNTVVDFCVNINNRATVVEEKLREFASAKLVITDRLHGMIFAAITGTPCIAFDNSSGKVSGGYEWLKGLDYIRYDSNFCLADFMNNEGDTCDKNYRNIVLDMDYKLLRDIILD